MKIKPNMSALLILTQSKPENYEESLIFMIKRPISDYSNKACIRWEVDGKTLGCLDLKQRLAFCQDKKADEVFNSILTNNSFYVKRNPVKINVPTYTKETIRDLYYEQSSISYKCVDKDYLPYKLVNEHNWICICGYVDIESNQQYIKPIGFLSPYIIAEYMKNNQIALNLSREPQIVFKGVRSQSVIGKGSKVIIGFVQDIFISGKNYAITIFDDKDELLGQGDIDKSNGFFRVELSDYVIKGELQYSQDIANILSHEFSLITSVNIKMKIINDKMIDCYGREVTNARDDF